MKIWDTAGQERFKCLTKKYFEDADACVVVFDLTNKTSFENVTHWLRQLKINTPKDTVIVLLGNKCDLNESKEVKDNEIEDFVKEKELPYMKVSAKTGENVEKTFDYLAKGLYVKIIASNEKIDSFVIGDNEKKIERDKKDNNETGCC